MLATRDQERLCRLRDRRGACPLPTPIPQILEPAISGAMWQARSSAIIKIMALRSALIDYLRDRAREVRRNRPEPSARIRLVQRTRHPPAERARATRSNPSMFKPTY